MEALGRKCWLCPSREATDQVPARWGLCSHLTLTEPSGSKEVKGHEDPGHTGSSHSADLEGRGESPEGDSSRRGPGWSKVLALAFLEPQGAPDR